MGRSGYSEDFDGDGAPPDFYRQAVAQAIRGKRGRKFLEELAAVMDAMPVKRLIADELVTPEGECCTMGAVCVARGMDVSKVDYDDPNAVGRLFDIAPSMAAEIAYHNDETYAALHETPEERWLRMRKWVADGLAGVVE